jgi:hypothetical protein
MDGAVDVPEEFTGSALTVPNVPRTAANTGTLYLRLRDDPETVQTLNLPITAAVPGTTPAAADSAATAIPAPKSDPVAPEAPSDTPAQSPKPTPKTDSASAPGTTPTPHP